MNFHLLISLCAFILFVSHSSFAGGVSGGGGNVINPIPPDSGCVPDHDYVEELVQKSRYPIFNFLKRKSQQLNSNQLIGDEKIVFQKLINSKENIFEIVNHVKPHVEEDQPCFDNEGNPVDGSTLSSKPNSICISAQRLIEKVHVKELPPQTRALLLHEYSEVSGLSEEEATFIQTKALEEMKY